MWKFLQILVVFAVIASNIHWQWTPNGYLASLIGVAAAFLVSISLAWLIDLVRRLSVWVRGRSTAKTGAGHQRIQ